MNCFIVNNGVMRTWKNGSVSILTLFSGFFASSHEWISPRGISCQLYVF